jgi:group I intron endonuclease
MPRNPIDYSKTIIYKLCCNDINITEIYIGSTTDFKARKYQHKSSCNNEKNKRYNLKVYQYIRDNGGWDNWSMIMIEEYSCNSKLEAEKRERYYIEELKSTLNYNIPTRTIKEYNKKHYEEFKEDYKIRWKQYYINNLDYNKERVKTYRNEHKEECLEWDRNRYNNNKEYFKNRYENKKEEYLKIIKCECGCEITKMNLIRHLQTKKHQEYLKGSIPENNTSEIVA